MILKLNRFPCPDGDLVSGFSDQIPRVSGIGADLDACAGAPFA